MTKDPELSGPSPQTTAERYGPPWERHYDTTFTTETNIATWNPLDETGLRISTPRKYREPIWGFPCVNLTDVKMSPSRQT